MNFIDGIRDENAIAGSGIGVKIESGETKAAY